MEGYVEQEAFVQTLSVLIEDGLVREYTRRSDFRDLKTELTLYAITDKGIAMVRFPEKFERYWQMRDEAD